MAENASENTFLKFLKTLGEIGGYVAAIITYLLALTGQGGQTITPYPITVSNLTALVTVIVVFLWRWPKLSEKSAVEPPGAEEQASKRTLLGKLIIILTSNDKRFIKSLLQRRLEIFSLASLFVGILTLGGMKMSSMAEEISGLNCINPSAPFRVMVTDFTFSKDRVFEKNLANALVRLSKDKFQVCRYEREIEFTEDAAAAAERYHMDLALWGSFSNDRYSISFYPEDVVGYENPKGEPIEGTDEQLAFVAAKFIASIYLVQGDIPAAQTTLELALDIADEQDWAVENPASLADGYFLMGQILAANPGEGPLALEPAIQAYTEAIRQDQNFEIAYWHRAFLYSEEGNIEKALADYDALIAINHNLVVDAYLVKTDIYLKVGDCETALQTINSTLQLPSMDDKHEKYGDLIFTLGKTHLLCGSYSEAQSDFERLPVLDADTAAAYIDELGGIAESFDDPVLKDEFQKAIAIIEKKQLP